MAQDSVWFVFGVAAIGAAVVVYLWLYKSRTDANTGGNQMSNEQLAAGGAREVQNADVRYTFTGQFLEASTFFVRRLRQIEAQTSWTEAEQVEHRGLVVAVVMQCAAALETESHEIAVHGPGAHLGSNGTDMEAQRFLHPISEIVDDQSTLDRFDLMLHLLGKSPIDHGQEPYQSASLVVRLRNEIVHYKSRWGAEMKSTKLYKALLACGHKPPPFMPEGVNYFPLRCLNADLAAWCVTGTVAFLDLVYSRLGTPSRFRDYRARVTP